jgi:hypothetical protein
VNTDPLVSSKDRQSELLLRDFISPFPNISRLEVDYTMLEPPDDARIKEQLDAMPWSEDMQASDFRQTGSIEESRMAANVTSHGRIRKSDRQESSIEASDITGPCKMEPRTAKPGAGHSLTAFNLESFQLKVSAQHRKFKEEDLERGLMWWHLKQHHLLFCELDMPNLRHVHITYDFDSANSSRGQVVSDMLSKVGMQVWPLLETLRICLVCELDREELHPEDEEPPAVSGSFNPLWRPSLNPLHNQEDLLWAYVHAFDEPRWSGPKIVLLAFIRDINHSKYGQVPETVTAQELAADSLSTCGRFLPQPIWFEGESRFSGTVPPNLDLELHAFAQPPLLQKCVPLGIVRHDAATHRPDISDKKYWPRHFEFIKYAPKVSTLIEGIRTIALLDIDEDDDLDFVLDSDETSSATSSESGISDSFRRSPSPF